MVQLKMRFKLVQPSRPKSCMHRNVICHFPPYIKIKMAINLAPIACFIEEIGQLQ